MPKPLKKPAPLSVRLSQSERDSLLIRAGTHTLSEYVKQVLFDGPQPLPRSGGVTLANRTLLAHLLATLGASDLAPNLDRLAGEAEAGNLFADRVTTRRLRAACDDVRLMRNALMRGLGMKEGPSSRQELRAREAFAKAAEPEAIVDLHDRWSDAGSTFPSVSLGLRGEGTS